MLGDFEIFPFTVLEEVEMVIRISLAAIVIEMINYERRRSSTAAGIHTLALVSMGAGTFTVISIFAFFLRKPDRGNGEDDEGVQL
jgi:uncharacterized membrane protein YhiD involved in acid resistance|tara:strand:- start:383 stop:637 length:255 start_codon:yes stop_codon:yes gene_type:complete